MPNKPHTLSESERNKELKRLMDRYSHSIMNRFLEAGFSKDIASELLADVFIKYDKVWQDYRRKDVRIVNPGGMLYKISKNLLYDHLRHMKRQKDAFANDMKSLSSLEQQLPDFHSPETEYIENEHWKILNTILSTLRPRRREIVVLRLLGYSQADIAEKLGITESTVSTLLSKARAEIEAKMHQYNLQA